MSNERCCSSALQPFENSEIRRLVPLATFQSLVVTGLNYGNAVLVRLPTYLVQRLQSVLNAAAWVIFYLRFADHITDTLATLHWLRISERIEYIALLSSDKVERIRSTTSGSSPPTYSTVPPGVLFTEFTSA